MVSHTDLSLPSRQVRSNRGLALAGVREVLRFLYRVRCRHMFFPLLLAESLAGAADLIECPLRYRFRSKRAHADYQRAGHKLLPVLCGVLPRAGLWASCGDPDAAPAAGQAEC
jgi:hypothetical protein